MSSKWMNKLFSRRSSESQEEKDDISTENLLPRSADDPWKQKIKRESSGAGTVLNVLLFIFSCFVLLHTGYQKQNSHHELLKKTSAFSPVLEQFDISTHIKQTVGNLFEPEHPSPYRNARKPDPTVDKAWEDLDNIRTFPITREDIIKLGKDPELAVKFPEEYGLGSEAYVAELDIFHQIHCLNLLRNIAWSDYSHREKKMPSELHWVHVSHCTDMLMQTITCQGSLDVLTFEWMETQDWPWPDFFVNRQCRDFESIVKWQEDHSLPLMMGRNLTRPEGAKEIPAPAAFYEVFGDENVTLHH